MWLDCYGEDADRPVFHTLTEQLRWPGPNCDHAPEPHGRAVHCRGRQFRLPHRRRDLRSLRGKSVQAAFRGVLVCQGVRKSSLPGKARGFGGQEDTLEQMAMVVRGLDRKRLRYRDLIR